jgi:malate dehydrogenase (oxaloacetate-decarboxylating)(NADP+)
LASKIIQRFKITPRIALLTYSNFGSSEEEDAIKMREATKILHSKHPDIVVDGEIQANFALNRELRDEIFPFSELARKNTNTLIFPNLSSGNIAYKLMQEMAGFESIGPILLGMKKPVHILQLGSSVREIVNMVTIAVADVQTRK